MKNSRFICLILVVFVLLSGLGLGNMEVAISYEDMCAFKTNSYMTSADVFHWNVQICTVETMGSCENSVVESFSSHCRSEKNECKDVLEILHSNALTRLGEKIYLGSEVIEVCDYYQEELVANYIHKLDGKKRI